VREHENDETSVRWCERVVRRGETDRYRVATYLRNPSLIMVATKLHRRLGQILNVLVSLLSRILTERVQREVLKIPDNFPEEVPRESPNQQVLRTALGYFNLKSRRILRQSN